MNSDMTVGQKALGQNPDGAGKAVPPPIPRVTPSADPMLWDPWTRERLEAFGRDYQPVASGLSWMSVLDALLKRPASIACELITGSRGRTATILLATVALCMLAYGFIMGTFSGGHQLWAVPVKVMAGCFLSALICLPSLYILSSLAGAKQSFGEIGGLFLQALALTGILMVGFMPIAWIFSQSTERVTFMGGMHLVFWMVAAAFGLQVLIRALRFVNQQRMSVLYVWGGIFLVVSLQMCTVLRPLIGDYEKSWVREKKFFMAHWDECLKSKPDESRDDRRP